MYKQDCIVKLYYIEQSYNIIIIIGRVPLLFSRLLIIIVFIVVHEHS